MNIGRLLRETDLDTEELRSAIAPVDPGDVYMRRASPLVQKIWGGDIRGVTLWNLILIRPDMFDQPPERLAALAIHELVHVRQWRQLGMIGFGFRYFSAYIRGRLAGKSHHESYMDNPFEIEAREIQRRLS